MPDAAIRTSENCCRNIRHAPAGAEHGTLALAGICGLKVVDSRVETVGNRANPEADLRELYTRICFNAAISNIDDHPRNHAILAKGRPWRLSPAFDLTPSPVVLTEHRDLAMACGPYGRYANRTNILSEPGRFLLEAGETAKIFDSMVETVRAQWHPTMRRAGVSERDCETIRSAFVYEGLLYEAEV